MMYSEFAEGTGCRDNAHNHEVFRRLEILYMESDLSKEEIYEMGKKLVDNSKSEEQLKLESEINAEIAELKEQLNTTKADIDYYQREAEKYKGMGFFEVTEADRWWLDTCKSRLKYYKGEAKAIRNKIKSLKWVLA